MSGGALRKAPGAERPATPSRPARQAAPARLVERVRDAASASQAAPALRAAPKRRGRSIPAPLLFAAAAVLLATAGGARAVALNGEAVTDFTPTAALEPTQGPGSSSVQAETTRVTTQVAISDREALLDNLSVSGTVWGLLDSLPTYNPTQVPPDRLALSSRLLQLDVVWQIIPGELLWDTGKEIIHPSSGFFKTPLNLISRGPAGNVPEQVPAASPQWEEGWVGTKVMWLVGNFTIEDFFSPRLEWSSAANSLLQYVSVEQPDYQNQMRIDLHLGSVDLQALGLVSTGGPGSSDPDLHFQAGAGIDASVGQALTLRAEASAADSQSRLIAVIPAALATATQEVAWAPRALAGFTWSFTPDLSLMGEYYYNGLGFVGDDYSRLIQYTQARASAGSTAPDLLGQFGSFDAARHYGFLRLAYESERLSLQAWSEVNLQDLSGMIGEQVGVTNDRWGVSGSLLNTWGGPNTEGGNLPLLWQLDIEAQLYF